MPNTRDINLRIRSVTNISQVTRAMEMVSAVKMRKAQQRVTASRPYSDQLRQIMSDLATQQPDPEQLAQFPLLQKRPVRTVELIVVTPDRGLTGALNSNILRRASRFILEETPPSSGGGLGGETGWFWTWTAVANAAPAAVREWQAPAVMRRAQPALLREDGLGLGLHVFEDRVDARRVGYEVRERLTGDVRGELRAGVAVEELRHRRRR